MSDNTFKTQSITTKDSTKFSLSLLSLSLLAALSMSNPAYADCTKDTSDANRTVMNCIGEVNKTEFDNVTTDNLTINNTGHISEYPTYEYSLKSIEFISAGGKLSGFMRFGLNGDTLTLSNTDTSDLAALWGHQNSYNMPDREAEKIKGIDTLNINQDISGGSRAGAFPHYSGVSINNWNIINIGKNASGTLRITGGSLDTDSNVSGYFGIKDSLNIFSQGTLSIAQKHAPGQLSSYITPEIFYNIVNEGNIYFEKYVDSPSYNSILNIIGNYEGKPGSKIFVNSQWNNPDEQKTDVFAVSGKASGQSEIVVNNGILGDITAGEVEKNGLLKSPVVIVANNENKPGSYDIYACQGTSCLDDEKLYVPLPEDYTDVFYGKAQTTNAGEAQLKRVGNRYYWTLKAKLPTPEDKPEYVDIINKSVSGYLQQPYINQQMMQEQLGKLHERIAKFDKALVEKQVWVRTNYDSTKLEGQDRFGADVKSSFIQIGGDIALSQSQDAQQRTGLMFTYGWANSKFFDNFRAENAQVITDKFTGKARANMLSIGGYHTYYGKNGFYVDSVAQLSWLQNSYDSFGSKAKQNAWGLGASVEVGKAFPILNPKLAIEPQAQLTYQRIWFDGFTDGIKKVQQHSQDRLTARLGGRLIWTENINNKASQLYFSANLIQLLKGKETSIQVGRESISESYGKLAAEFGIGGEYPITPNLSLYANMRYAMGLQSSGSKSYKGHIGLNYRF